MRNLSITYHILLLLNKQSKCKVYADDKSTSVKFGSGLRELRASSVPHRGPGNKTLSTKFDTKIGTLEHRRALLVERYCGSF